MVISYIEDIAKRLHDPTQYGSASVMVGAGFSKNAISLDERVTSPNWEELASLMYSALYPKSLNQVNPDKWEENRIRKIAGKNVLKLAEEYKTMFKRNKLDQFIEQNINDDKYMPGELHKMLLELNWRDVFTTNYDTLLERTIDKIAVRKNYKVLTNQSDLPGSTNPRIIKLHGSIKSSKPYIICEEDYRTYPVKYAPFVNTVQQAMLETQLCLIGFSGDDPNFLNWLGWLRDNMGENCPQIYLCGIFHSMSEPERRTLESQNISIVDLGELFDDGPNFSHFDALKLFFEKLKNYGKDKKDIFRNFAYARIKFEHDVKMKMDDLYLEKMITYTENLREEASDYVLLPFKSVSDTFIDDLKFQFHHLLRLDFSNKQIVLLGNMVYLLRRLYIVLEDNSANLIENLLKSINFEDILNDLTLSNALSEILIYLLEMYRVDGEWDFYDQINDKIRLIYNKLEPSEKVQFDIESAKYHLSKFEYNKALEIVNKIEDDSPIELQLKKACLFIQLSERQKALDILKRSSAALAQKAYSEDKTASLLSYMNLCARALNIRDVLNDFTDNDYAANQYNLRKIINDMKDEVGSDLLLASKKSLNVINSFNPGAYRVTYGTTPKEIQKALSTSLRYVMFQDYLALPVFSDHKEIYALSLMEIIKSSKNPLWKWSSIARIKDKKIIDAFFSRDRIISSERVWAASMFDQLLNLLDCFDSNESFSHSEKIISRPLIINLLSRLCIVLEDSKIIVLVERLLSFLEKQEDDIEREINESFGRIQFCFNSDILKHFIFPILNSNLSPSWVSNMFMDLQVLDFDEPLSPEIIKCVVQQIKSEDIKTRDNGIAKAILVHEYFGSNELFSAIAEAIWERTDQYGFPKSDMYTILLWEELPHHEDVDFKKLYMNYLSNPQFPKCVNGASISAYGNIDNIMDVYFQCFYKNSFFSRDEKRNVDFKSEIFESVLEYIFTYLDNEKKLLTMKFDLFGETIEGRKRFSKLSDFVSILMTQAFMQSSYNEKMEGIVDEIKKLLVENEIQTLSINTIDSIIKSNFDSEKFDQLMNTFIIGENKDVSQASISIDILFVICQTNHSYVWVVDSVLSLIQSIQFMDIHRSRIVLSNLMQFIERSILTDQKAQNIITKSFTKCYEKFDLEINEVNKELLDAIYTLSVAVKRYYKTLIRKQLDPNQDLKSLIQKLKASDLKEVKYMWEGYL